MLKVAPLLVILAGFCMQLIFVCTTMTSLVCPCARHIHDILTQDIFMFFSAAWIGYYKNLPFTASQHSAGYLPVVPSLVCWYLGSLSTDSYDTWSWLQVRISLACTLCLSDSQDIVMNGLPSPMRWLFVDATSLYMKPSTWNFFSVHLCCNQSPSLS